MISVVGPGGVGGLLAGLLARAGIETTVVARETTARRIAAEGLTIDSAPFGRFHVDVPTATTVPAGSAVVLAVKAYGLADVLPALAAARPSEVLSILNGVGHAGLLHAALEPDALVACGAIQVEAERLADGTIAHRSPFCLVTAPEGTEQWRVLRSLTAAGVSTRTRGTEEEVLWGKLRFLAPLALLTTITDRPLGPALDHDPALTTALLDDVAALATAAGLPTTAGLLAEQLRGFDPAMQSSLQVDARRGGPTELDALGTHLLELAARHGLATPALARVVDTIGARLGA